MKLLKIKVDNFKNLEEKFIFDFYSKAYKSDLDKSTELQEITDELYTFNTISIIGKNASGKTMVFSLLENVYSMFRNFRIRKQNNLICEGKSHIYLELYFFDKQKIYKYITKISEPKDIFSSEFYLFEEQKIFSKSYKKTNYIKEKETYFSDDNFEEEFINETVPSDMSKLYMLYKETLSKPICLSYESEDYQIASEGLKLVLDLYKDKYIENSVIVSILKILDTTICEIRSISDDEFYVRRINDEGKKVKFEELLDKLSSGTKKGMILFSYAYSILTSKSGNGVLLVDEIENHFHKKLVEYIITLFNDKEANKTNATLIFTTHYCEILDNFRRSDNIWLTKSNGKIKIENLYEVYDLRKDILKSKQFYKNAFDTKISYDSLINFRKEIIK